MISRQGHLLGQHDQALQEITTALRELTLAVRSQPPVAPEPSAPAPGPSASPREPAIPAPQRYGGDLGSCRSFLTQCSLVFEMQPQTYPTERSRIAYLIGSLSGEALAWAAAVWERGSEVCNNYGAFTEDMRKVFDHPVRGKEASQRLLQLRQGSRSVASFAVEFRTLAAESGWNEEALQGVFQNALSSELKDRLTSWEEPKNLDHLISLAIHMDNRCAKDAEKEAPIHSPRPLSSHRLQLSHPTRSPLLLAMCGPLPPSRCRLDAHTLLPRRGNVVSDQELVCIAVLQDIVDPDVQPSREKNGLVSNPRDTGESLL